MKCGIVYDTAAAAAARQKQIERDAVVTMRWFYTFVPLVVIGVIFFLAKTPGCSSSSTPAERPGAFVVKPYTLGCQTLEDYKQLSRLAGDLPAFEKAMRESVLKGACRWLPVGNQAYLEDYKMTADAAKVRVRGETRSYWVPGKSAK